MTVVEDRHSMAFGMTLDVALWRYTVTIAMLELSGLYCRVNGVRGCSLNMAKLSFSLDFVVEFLQLENLTTLLFERTGQLVTFAS
jgi:hypothetical protein